MKELRSNSLPGHKKEESAITRKYMKDHTFELWRKI